MIIFAPPNPLELATISLQSYDGLINDTNIGANACLFQLVNGVWVQKINTSNAVVATGDIVFMQDQITLFNGDNKWWKINLSLYNISVPAFIDTNGNVLNVGVICS
jgi:hypothetical protein